MKLMIKVLALIFIIGMSGLFVLKRPDGRPWLSVSDFVPSPGEIAADAKNAFGNSKEALAGGQSENLLGQRVYKWQDAQGNWQFSDTPPPAATNSPVETITLEQPTNIVPGVEVPKPTSSVKENGAEGTGFPLPLTVSPGQVQKLVDDAKNIQNLSDERQKQLDAL